MPNSRSSLPQMRPGILLIQCLGIDWELHRATLPGRNRADQIQCFLFQQRVQETSKSSACEPLGDAQSFPPWQELSSPDSISSLPPTSLGNHQIQETRGPWGHVEPGETGPASAHAFQCLGIVWELHRASHSGSCRAAQIPGLLLHKHDQKTSRSNVWGQPGN